MTTQATIEGATAVTETTAAVESKPAETTKPAAKKAAKPAAKKAAKPAAKKAAKKASKPAKATKKASKPADGDEQPVKGPGVLRRYAVGYNRDTERRTIGGHVSVDCGDTIAEKLRGQDLDSVYKFSAKALGEDEKALRAKYKHLNVGMQRMNLGNRVRAVLAAK